MLETSGPRIPPSRCHRGVTVKKGSPAQGKNTGRAAKLGGKIKRQDRGIKRHLHESVSQGGSEKSSTGMHWVGIPFGSWGAR